MAGERERPSSVDDRISNLPCPIVDHILTLLPLRDAVRTSILSKAWKHTWLTIPHLVIHPNFNASLSKNWAPQLESIVYRLLLHHKGPIRKFSVDCYDNDITPLAIDNWLYILFNHRCGVEDLELLLSGRSGEIGTRIMHCLFSFENLKNLSFECEEDVVFKLPSSFLGFSKLLRLDLSVVISFKVLKEFVSKCPLLEFLAIYNEWCDQQMHLDIIAPNLKCFEYTGWFNSICLETPRLEKITFVIYKDTPNLPGAEDDNGYYSVSNLNAVCSQMSSVKELHTDQGFLKQFYEKGDKLTVNFNHLHYLCLEFINLEEIDDVSIAVCLIENSPILQTLRLILDNNVGLMAANSIQYIREQQNCQCPLSRTLKNVMIEDFDGLEEEAEFVKLFLLSATALQKVEIQCSRRYSKNYLNEDMLASFPRASPEAVVLFR